jgi:uncharacterized PurR-regulated membrane protein YhhQ (DUF165 family)
MNTRRLAGSAAVLFIAYAAVVATANAASAFLPAAVVASLQVPAGAFFAGIAFTLRDLLQDATDIRATVLAIAIGTALSGLVATPRIALASAAAFAISELADLAIYTLLRDRNRITAVGLSNTFGLVVDSLLFLPLAFGSLTYLSGHIAAKTATTVLAVAVLTNARTHHRAVDA